MADRKKYRLISSCAATHKYNVSYRSSRFSYMQLSQKLDKTKGGA